MRDISDSRPNIVFLEVCSILSCSLSEEICKFKYKIKSFLGDRHDKAAALQIVVVGDVI